MNKTLITMVTFALTVLLQLSLYGLQKQPRDWCPTTLTMEILITGVIDTDPSSDYIISVNGHCSFAFLADINIRQITHEENDVAICL